MSRDNQTRKPMNPDIHTKSFSRRLLALAAAATLAAGSWTAAQLSAATLTWDPAQNNTGSDGSGNWDTSSSLWATGSGDTTWVNGDFATIGSGGVGGTINIDAPVTAAGITFNSVTSPYTFSRSGTGALSLTNSVGISIVMNADATISAPITFNNSFTVSGGYRLMLSGATNFVGTDNIQIGNGAAQATIVVLANTSGTGSPAQIIFDSGIFKFTGSGNGFNQPVISTDNGTAVTNTFDAGGSGNSQDISSTITQSKADTFVLQDGTIYLTGANSSTFTAGTLQIGNGSLTSTVDFGYNGSNNLPANGVTLALVNASLTQASAAGPNGEAVDTAANIISNAMTLEGANTINTGTLHSLTITGNITNPISGTGSLTVNGDGVSNQTLFLEGANTYSGTTTISAGTLALSGSGSIADSSYLSLSSGATFDISGITASSAAVNNLVGASGSTVNLGAKTLAVTSSGYNTFSGVIQGSGGGLTLSTSTTFH